MKQSLLISSLLLALSFGLFGQPDSGSCIKFVEDSTLIQQDARVAHFDDFDNNIIRPEDGALYGAINCTHFEKAISYQFPIMKAVVYGPSNFTIHSDYEVEEKLYIGKTVMVVFDLVEKKATIYKPKE